MGTLTHRRKQFGVTLIEAMVAMVIMAFGMVALIGLQSNLRRSADLARQRGEAVRIAQQQIERMRDYSVLTAAQAALAPAGVLAYEDIATPNAPFNAGDANSNASFMLNQVVTPWVEDSSGTETMKAVSINVSWADRAGGTQFIETHTFIASADPGLSGSLSIPPISTPLRRPADRDSAIPIGAKDFGNKTSVFKPQPGGTVAWIFNHIGGAVIGRCTVPAGTPTAVLALADLSTCDRTRSGLLLSGYVRFSDSVTPDSATPSSTAVPLDMVMNVTDGDAADPNYECYDDAPTSSVGATATAVSYYCVVYPNNSTVPSWSGTLRIKNIPVSIDDQTVVSPWQVCRYSGNYNGDRVIGNFEHPLTYTQVAAALTSQNFLLVRASATCPAGQVADPARGIYANTQTVLHQSLAEPNGVDTPRPN